MSGGANQKRWKQGRPMGTSEQQSSASTAVGPAVCPLYSRQPVGAYYRSWIDCESLGKTGLSADTVTQRAHAFGRPDVLDLTRRMPYFSVIYGRFIPMDAAYLLDLYIDSGALPIRWTTGGPTMQIPVAGMAEPYPCRSAAEARATIHDTHAKSFL
jgi:hypothetical protein